VVIGQLLDKLSLVGGVKLGKYGQGRLEVLIPQVLLHLTHLLVGLF
jgi:hypothetical protein